MTHRKLGQYGGGKRENRPGERGGGRHLLIKQTKSLKSLSPTFRCSDEFFIE